MQNHYNNENGSLYKFAEDHGLNSWEFDLVKRIVRCRKKGQFREDLEKSKFLIDLYLLEMEESTPAPVTTYSYSVIENTLGGFDFTIKEKGEEVYQHFGHYETELEAVKAAQEWIKEQSAHFTTYSYSVTENPGGSFDFTIKDKGEEVFQDFGYERRLQAQQAAKKWIKEQKEPTPAPVSDYSYSIESGYCGHSMVYDFIIKYKGKKVHEGLQYGMEYRAELAALKWIKEQEEDSEYTYDLEQYDNRWAYQIYKKGEKEYWNCEETKELAHLAALKWIKTNTKTEKEG